jgi:hypothetical protein
MPRWGSLVDNLHSQNGGLDTGGVLLIRNGFQRERGAQPMSALGFGDRSPAAREFGFTCREDPPERKARTMTPLARQICELFDVPVSILGNFRPDSDLNGLTNWWAARSVGLSALADLGVVSDPVRDMVPRRRTPDSVTCGDHDKSEQGSDQIPEIFRGVTISLDNPAEMQAAREVWLRVPRGRRIRTHLWCWWNGTLRHRVLPNTSPDSLWFQSGTVARTLWSELRSLVGRIRFQLGSRTEYFAATDLPAYRRLGSGQWVESQETLDRIQGIEAMRAKYPWASTGDELMYLAGWSRATELPGGNSGSEDTALFPTSGDITDQGPERAIDFATGIDVPWPELCKQCHHPAPFPGRVNLETFGESLWLACPDPFHLDISAMPAQVGAEGVAGRGLGLEPTQCPCALPVAAIPDGAR